MAVTISTHNGSKIAPGHNQRLPEVVRKEKHIDPDRPHEIWKHEDVRDAYKRIFGAAQKEYNDKQKRADRKIKDYYRTVENDARKHPAYELIVGVYGAYGNYEDDIDHETGKEILKEFVDGWTERNPNLELVGAYYHADEDGQPHVHIDYIPVAHGFQRGMKTQSALRRALEEQGFETKSNSQTAQIAWEARENAHLEELCNQRGLEVTHPAEEHARHRDTETYKAEMEHERALEKLNKIEKTIDELQPVAEDLLARTYEPERKIFKKKRKVTYEGAEVDEVRDALENREKYKNFENEKIAWKEQRRQIEDDWKAEQSQEQQKIENDKKRLEQEQQNQKQQVERLVQKQLEEEKQKLERAKNKEMRDLRQENNSLKLSNNSIKEYNKRKNDFMKSIKYSDGTSVYDQWEAAEQWRENHLNQQNTQQNSYERDFEF